MRCTSVKATRSQALYARSSASTTSIHRARGDEFLKSKSSVSRLQESKMLYKGTLIN